MNASAAGRSGRRRKSKGTGAADRGRNKQTCEEKEAAR